MLGKCFICKKEINRAEMVEVFAPDGYVVMACPTHLGINREHEIYLDAMRETLFEAAINAKPN